MEFVYPSDRTELENFDHYNSYSDFTNEINGNYTETTGGSASFITREIAGTAVAYSNKCLYYEYNLPAGGDSIGFSKFLLNEDWSDYLTLSLWIKGTNVPANNWRINFTEADGDQWRYVLTGVSNVWQNFIIPLRAGSWTLNVNGGDGVFSITNIVGWSMNTSTPTGSLSGCKIWIDEIYFGNIIPNKSPTITDVKPTNNQINVYESTNIYFELKDDYGVDRNSLNVHFNNILYISNNKYVTNIYLAITNGTFQNMYSGSYSVNSSNGYNYTITPANDFPTGTLVFIDIEVSDYSNATSTYSSSFITRGPGFGITSPSNNQMNVFTNSDISIYMDRVDTNSMNVMINGTYAISNNIELNGYTKNIISYGSSNRVQLIVNTSNMPFSFGSTNQIKVWAHGCSDIYVKTNNFQFRVINNIPEIQNIYPYNGMVNVPIDSNLYFDLVDNEQIVSNSINVMLNNDVVINNGQQNSDYSVTFTTNKFNGYHILINPGLNLYGDAQYTLKIWCSDNDGNAITNVTGFNTINLPVITVSPAGGIYVNEVEVNFSANKTGVLIYYTIDETIPNTNSKYFINSGTLNIRENTIIKYFGRDSFGNNTSIFTQTYKIVRFTDDVQPIPNVVRLDLGEKSRIFFKKSMTAKVNVYNITGDLVKSYDEKYYNKGDYIEFPTDDILSDIGAGLCIVYIKGDGVDIKKKIILIK